MNRRQILVMIGILLVAGGAGMGWRRYSAERTGRYTPVPLEVPTVPRFAGSTTDNTPEAASLSPERVKAALMSPSTSDEPARVPVPIQGLLSKSPPPLQAWGSDFIDREVQGYAATEKQMRRLEEIVADADIDPTRCIQMLSVVLQMDGPVLSERTTDILLSRSATALAKQRAEGNVPRELLAALWVLHRALWKYQVMEQDQKLLEMLARWENPGSGHAQLTEYEHAESLYLQQKFSLAAEAFQQAGDNRSIANEPSEGIRRPLDWEIAVALYSDGKYHEAIPHLRAALQVGGATYLDDAWGALISSLARSGDTAGANEALDDFIRLRNPSVSTVVPFLDLIDKSELLKREAR